MRGKKKVEGMLNPYRVLDLTDEKGFLCGKLLGDMGADVIKIEKTGGDSARNIGPFYQDDIDPEKSLYWWAFNTSKRGITLDIETDRGKDTFRHLVKTADFVIESFQPGYMERLGLGYTALEAINPAVIVVSITPFGQTGPYKDYKVSDIVSWAMSGYMGMFGDKDRAPVRISHHFQSYLHAGAEAAIGAMMALHHRTTTEQGQHVDVSIRDSVARMAYRCALTWDLLHEIQQRGEGLIRYQKGFVNKAIWPCKDGYVFWKFFSGVMTYQNLILVKWMEEEGATDDYIRNFDWQSFDLKTTTQEVIGRLAESAIKFFMTHTKAELLDGAVARRLILFPVSTINDLLGSSQLAAREYWVELEHPELRTSMIYPGAFIHASEAPPRLSRRAPCIGEHNLEIYEELNNRSEGPRSAQFKIDDSARKPLEGIRVVDFTRYAAGPYATRALANQGAEVIRVEGRIRIDGSREYPPFRDGIVGENRSGGFNSINTSKLSVGLNLADPKGVELAKRLVAQADIVVENFAGGVMKKLGLDYDELRKVKPDIIMLSSCMMGQTGPHARQPGFGPHLTALVGFNSVSGWPDREPPDFGAHTDFIAPLFSAFSILSAIDYRRRTGRGVYFDSSQFENGIQFLSPLVLDYTVNGRVAHTLGNRSVYAAPHGAYRCSGEDRWCVIAVSTEDDWKKFSNVIGNPGWVQDPRFLTFQARKENEDELDRLVEQWTIKFSPEEVMTKMQREGIPAGIIETGEDMLKDPQFEHRHFLWFLDHPEIGKYPTVGPAFKLSKSPCELRRGPLLGEHNDYVFGKLLGMSDEEIAELIKGGVIE